MYAIRSYYAEKTEKTIDGATTGENNNTETQNSGSPTNNSTVETNQTSQSSQASPAMNPMLSKKMDTSKLPDSYEFDWEFKTEMSTSKGDKIQMNYLLNFV